MKAAAPAGSAPATPSGYLLAAAALLLIAPIALLAWVGGTAALRLGARRWVLALCGLVPGMVAAYFVAPRMGAAASLAAAQVFGAAGNPCRALLGPLAAWFARWAVLTAPIGVPVGMVAAAILRQTCRRFLSPSGTPAGAGPTGKAPTSAPTPSLSPSVGWSSAGGSATWSCPQTASSGWPGC